MFCYRNFITFLSVHLLRYVTQVLDADLPPYDEYSISMISGDNSYFSLVDEHIELLQPLDVPPGILLSEYTIGRLVTK